MVKRSAGFSKSRSAGARRTGKTPSTAAALARRRVANLSRTGPMSSGTARPRSRGVTNRQTGGEIKFSDVTSALIPIRNTTVANETVGIIPLTMLVNNGLSNGRIGSRVKGLSLELKLSIDLYSSASATGFLAPNSLGRVLVVLDTQSNGAVPPLALMLAAVESTTPADPQFSAMAPPNPSYKTRFSILREWILKLPAYRSTGASGLPATHAAIDISLNQQDPLKKNYIEEYFIPLGGMEMTYNSLATATVTALQSNHIFLVVTGTGPIATSPVAGYAVNILSSRFTFQG